MGANAAAMHGVVEILLGLFAGLGLFFIGMRVLSTYVKETTGYRVRVLAARLAKSRPLMMALGTVAGVVTQSTNAVTAAAVGLATAQLIRVREAFPLIACANIGTSGLVFLATFSLHEAVLALTALCGLLYFLRLDQDRAWRVAVGAMLGFVLIVLGVDMISAAARQIREVEAIRDVFRFAAGHLVGAFLLGAVLVPVLQTAKTVAVVVAVLAESGVLSGSDAIAAVIGANTTSALNVAFLASRVSPMGRALAYYQGLLKVVGSSIAVVALLVLLAVAPEAVGAATGASPAFAVAVAYLVMQALAYAATLPVEPAIAGWLVAVAERGLSADPSRPRFISVDALRDPASAAELAFREHLDVLDHLPHGLDRVREADDPAAAAPAGGRDGGRDESGGGAGARDHAAIGRAIDEFLGNLAGLSSDAGLRRRVGSLQRLNGLLVDLQDQTGRLVRSAARPGQHPAVTARIGAIVESAHFMLELFAAHARSGDPDDRAHLAELTGDRTAMMEGIRRALMSEGRADAESERDLFDASVCFERIVWLLRRYLLVADEPDAPYRDRIPEAREAAAGEPEAAKPAAAAAS